MNDVISGLQAKILDLEQQVAAVSARLAHVTRVIKEHEHCNSYECGRCVGFIVDALSEDLAPNAPSSPEEAGARSRPRRADDPV